MANILMALNWAIFYAIHTILASSKLKRFLKAKWPLIHKNYRIIYSLISFMYFLVILIQALYLPKEQLFETQGLISYSGYMIATLGVIIMGRSSKNISAWRFLTSEETSSDTLVKAGIYEKVRHPLYLGLFFIFLGYFFVAGTMAALIHLGCLALYLPIGIHFEEENLVDKFGVAYKKYQEEVPSFFPRLFK